MTMRFSLNHGYAATEGHKQMFDFKAFMVSASPAGPGWTIVRSNNGTTASAADNIATAADLSNVNSWFVLADPGGVRQLCFARTGNSSNHYWRFLYSVAAGFTGGTTAARPTATDEKIVFGDAVTATTGLVSGNICNLNFVADDAAPYGFAAIGFRAGFGLGNGFFMDPMRAGSFDALDQDPYVFYVIDANGTDGCLDTSLCSENENLQLSGCRAYVGDLSTTARFGNICALRYANTFRTIYPGVNGPTQNMSGKVPDLPLIYARTPAVTGPSGLKGISTYFKWNGAATANGDTVAGQTWAVMNNLLMQWDGSTVPTG